MSDENVKPLFGVQTENYYTRGGELRVRATLPNGKRKTFSFYGEMSGLPAEADRTIYATHLAIAKQMAPDNLSLAFAASGHGGFTFGFEFRPTSPLPLRRNFTDTTFKKYAILIDKVVTQGHAQAAIGRLLNSDETCFYAGPLTVSDMASEDESGDLKLNRPFAQLVYNQVQEILGEI